VLALAGGQVLWARRSLWTLVWKRLQFAVFV